MIFFSRYKTTSEIDAYLQKHTENIQVVVGNQYVSFGQAQTPMLNDYVDGIDTMEWLEGLL